MPKDGLVIGDDLGVLTTDDNLGRLAELPRTLLAHTPTPIEHLPNLSAQLAGASLYVKRDDCTGLAFGGNKARQLEFYLGEALSQNADTILISGAVQSNFVRSAAAAAAKLDLACHIQLEERVPNTDSLYRSSGNVLLNHLLGATLHSYSEGEDEFGADQRLRDIAADLMKHGRRPYVIPLAPGHPPLGAVGYVVAAREILAQLDTVDYSIDGMVVASGSGQTHAGLLFGLRAMGSSIPVLGVCVRRGASAQLDRVRAHCDALSSLLELQPPVKETDIQLTDDHLAPGYGQLNATTKTAISLGAQYEALLLDPAYTGKAFAGALQLARSLDTHQALLFIHTGGTPGIFAYGSTLLEEKGH